MDDFLTYDISWTEDSLFPCVFRIVFTQPSCRKKGSCSSAFPHYKFKPVDDCESNFDSYSYFSSVIQRGTAVVIVYYSEK